MSIQPVDLAFHAAKLEKAIKRTELGRPIYDAVISACDAFKGKAMSKRFATFIENKIGSDYVVYYDKCKFTGTISLKVWSRDNDSPLNYNNYFSTTLQNGREDDWTKESISRFLTGWVNNFSELDNMKAARSKIAAHVKRYNELVSEINECVALAKADGIYL